jgi:hypothetical protein
MGCGGGVTREDESDEVGEDLTAIIEEDKEEINESDTESEKDF